MTYLRYMQELNSNQLKKKPVKELTTIADQLATRLQWFHSTGKDKTDAEQYKRIASELLHVANLIEAKEIEKSKKPKNNYGN
tara:strand:- start:1512 stop:1757 length:246 start_codon:yes stop_codon:yes gene_type:complete